MRGLTGRLPVASGVLLRVVGLAELAAQAQTSHPMAGRPESAPTPVRATMSERHARAGVPKGWKFLLPPGDAHQGRRVFVEKGCFACHEVKGEEFSPGSTTTRASGPELTGMGAHHPGEYFAESIINPNRVIVESPGYTGSDRLSTMPSYADSMTVKQLVDLVAYLQSLKGGGMDHTSRDH